MSSAVVLDVESLVAAIPGDEPAGDAVPFGTRKKFDELRKEINPASFAADDPLRPDKPKFADWPGIIKLGKETLAETSKDLLVAARLTEALVKQHGFVGLRDGLKLLHRLVEGCWDRLHPAIEDGDVEVRATAFNWLDDVDRGARFPTTIRSVPVIANGQEGYGWQNWRDALDGKGKVKPEDIDQAMQAMAPGQCQQVVADLAEGIAELDHLGEALSQEMKDLAPGLVEIRRAMNDCRTLAQQVLDRIGPAPAAAPPPEAPAGPAPAGPAGTGSAGPADGVRRPLTREDVYAQLADVSAKLLQLDPHSPVTYLVQRAVRLSKKSLPQLIKALIQDDGTLTALNRDLDLGFDQEKPADED